MRQFSEINPDNTVQCVFDWDLPDQYVPEYAPPRIAVDVTNLDPQPQGGWTYNRETGVFTEPPPEG